MHDDDWYGKEHENNERWLVSYADFITLLFAFFVLMFASAQTDKARARQVSESVTRAFTKGPSYGIDPRVAKVLGGTVDDIGAGNAMMRGPGGQLKDRSSADEDTAELLPSMKMLSAQLKEQISKGQLEIRLESRGLVVSFKQAVLFQSGDDRVSTEGLPILERIADAIRQLPNMVRVEGHTDSVPIHNSRFRSNWELSAARSIAVMDILINRFGITKDRLAIVGYAENASIDSNESPEGRARNRRVDLVIQTTMISSAEAHGQDGNTASQTAGSTSSKKDSNSGEYKRQK